MHCTHCSRCRTVEWAGIADRGGEVCVQGDVLLLKAQWRVVAILVGLMLELSRGRLLDCAIYISSLQDVPVGFRMDINTRWRLLVHLVH